MSNSENIFLRNPDVVLREEDEDGGLLFNPDTNQVKVLNSTGLFIWKQLECAKQVDTIASSLQLYFSETPEEVVVTDVQDFIDGLVSSGFIGKVVSV